MEAYDNVVQSVRRKCVHVFRHYSMVDATNDILKLTIIDFEYVMVCGRDIITSDMPTF